MNQCWLLHACIICFCAIVLVPACAQTPVLETPDNLLEDLAWFYAGQEKTATALEIRAEELVEFSKVNMAAFTRLKTLVISFTEGPEAPFAEKQVVIDMVYKNLDFLAALKKCPALENIVLHVGEKLFIRGDEGLSEEADKLNLKRAGEKYADKIVKILPQVMVYAHNWGW